MTTDKFFEEHPVIGGALFVLAFTLALPLIAMTGWLA